MNAGSYGLANYRRAQDSPFEVLDLMSRSIKTNHTQYIGTVGTLSSTRTLSTSTLNSLSSARQITGFSLHSPFRLTTTS